MTGGSEAGGRGKRGRRTAGQQDETRETSRDTQRDTQKEPESGNYSDPRIRWPDQEWRRTEQPGGEVPHSRATGDPGARPDATAQAISSRGETTAGMPPEDDTIPPARSDEAIRDDVREALDADAQCDAARIEIQVQAGAVVLEGRVPTRPMKHRAAEIAGGAGDVRTVDNRLQVG